MPTHHPTVRQLRPLREPRLPAAARAQPSRPDPAVARYRTRPLRRLRDAFALAR